MDSSGLKSLLDISLSIGSIFSTDYKRSEGYKFIRSSNLPRLPREYSLMKVTLADSIVLPYMPPHPAL